MKNILFISVDGTQNYLKSLFLPILSKVQNNNVNFEILEFCPNHDTLREDIVEAASKYKIFIHFGTYFNKPPIIGSLLFIIYGAIRTFYVVQKTKTDMLMPRSLLAGAMALLVRMFVSKLEIIYESDGLMSDERVDFGSWKKTGIIYKLFQRIERKLVQDSTIVITRTQKAKDVLLERSPNVDGRKIKVIPNGKNADLFKIVSEEKRTIVREKYGVENDDLLLIYVGSIGKQYRPDLMVDIFNRLYKKNKKIKFLILTPNQDEMKIIIDSKLTEIKNIFLDKVDSSEIADFIAAADIGLALRAPTFSQQAVCPLKVIEYLLCGIPVITNSGIGDMDELFTNHNVGYIIDNLNNIAYYDLLNFVKEVPNNFDVEARKRIRDIAIGEFDLNIVVERYSLALQERIK